MIPYETDPTLHDHEPPRAVLGDGFSPPPSDQPAAPERTGPATEATDAAPVVRRS